MTTAKHLIARSISHTEIVHADWTADIEADLSAECESSVNASDTLQEFWGTEDGDEWRVHLTGEREPMHADHAQTV